MLWRVKRREGPSIHGGAKASVPSPVRLTAVMRSALTLVRSPVMVFPPQKVVMEIAQKVVRVITDLFSVGVSASLSPSADAITMEFTMLLARALILGVHVARNAPALRVGS